MVKLTPQEEEMVLRAVVDNEIQQAVSTLRGVDCIKEIRRLLLERFPEVRSLPNHDGGFLSAEIPAEFHIAKAVVDLLK